MFHGLNFKLINHDTLTRGEFVLLFEEWISYFFHSFNFFF
jgi:hypothetical protein